MLKGFYSTAEGHRINLIGYDFDSYICFIATCPSGKDQYFFDKGVYNEEEGVNEYNPWNELYVQVNQGDIKLDDILVNGQKTEFNVNAFSRLGSIIRGMKSICIPQREESFYDISNFEEFGSKHSYSYTYFGNKINLIENHIDYLEYSNGDERLVLEDVYSESVPMSKNTSKQRKFTLQLEEFSRVDDLQTQDMSGFFDEAMSDEDVYSISEIIEKNPDKPYVWIKDRSYHIVNDLDEWKRIAKRIWNYNGVVAFDTETTGLNITFKSITGQGDQLVGLVFSIRRTKKDQEKINRLKEEGKWKDSWESYYGDAWYVPLAHKNVKNIVEKEQVSQFLEQYVKAILEQKDILCHNGSFDSKVMFIYGILINLVHDTFALLRLSYGAEDTLMKLGLKPNVKRFLGRDSFELSDFVKGKWGEGSVTFADLPYQSVKYYACPDTDSSLSLYELAVKENWFDRWGMKRVYELEVAFSKVIAYQEFFGHHVSVSKIAKLRKQLEEDVETYSSKIFEIAGYSLNLRSPNQLKKLLFDELDMPILEYTESGAPSTSKVAMKKYLSYKDNDGNRLYPIADYLLKYRDSAKLMSDFIKNIDTISTPDGFMFSSVKQFLETGRLSVSDPNYQSYNDTVKKYISPRKGYYMMDSDYSSVEIRIMMSMAQEDSMIKYLFDPDSDYHTLKASQMFSIPYELVSKSQRGAAKGVNFGIVYGMGDASLGENVTGVRSAESTRYGAQLRKLYFKGMDVTESFISSNLDKAVENRYAETFFGRRRYFPPTMRIGSVKRQGGNHPIQGTAADLYKQAMVNLYNTIQERGWWGMFLLPCFVHDEIVMEAHNSINPAIAMKVVRDSLMLAIEGWCPLYIGFGYGSHWYNAKKTEIPVQLQNSIIDQYGETGFPFWDGNIHELYSWEVSQIYKYKKQRIVDYMLDKDNKGQVISPVISGFLFEVMPYVKSVGKVKSKAKELLSQVENLLNSVAVDLGGLTRAIQSYVALDGCGVTLDKFKEPHSKFMDSIELELHELKPISEVLSDSDEDTLVYPNLFTEVFKGEEGFDRLVSMLDLMKEVCSGILAENYLEGLVTTEVELGGISQTLVAFGQAFGCEDLVSEANLQEPHDVEAEKPKEVENHVPDLSDMEEEDLMHEYVRSFGYYRNYEEGILYISGLNDSYLNFMVNYLLQSDAISKKSGDVYEEVKKEFYSGNTSYTQIRFVISEEGDLHKAVLFVPTSSASRICSMCVKAKAQVGS